MVLTESFFWTLFTLFFNLCSNVFFSIPHVLIRGFSLEDFIVMKSQESLFGNIFKFLVSRKYKLFCFPFILTFINSDDFKNNSIFLEKYFKTSYFSLILLYTIKLNFCALMFSIVESVFIRNENDSGLYVAKVFSRGFLSFPHKFRH